MKVSEMTNQELLLEYGDRSYASGTNNGTDQWAIANAERRNDLYAELLRRLNAEPQYCLECPHRSRFFVDVKIGKDGEPYRVECDAEPGKPRCPGCEKEK